MGPDRGSARLGKRDEQSAADGDYEGREASRHTESFLISKSWTLTPAFLAMRRSKKVVGAFEVYRWFAFVLITTPWFILGAWFDSYLPS